MKAEQLKCGTLINGQRVIRLTPGMVNGRRYVRAILADRTVTDPMFYGSEVPGTRPLTGFAAACIRGGGFTIKDRLIGPNRRGESDEARNRRLFGGRMLELKEAV